jgi:hypothetical protein
MSVNVLWIFYMCLAPFRHFLSEFDDVPRGESVSLALKLSRHSNMERKRCFYICFTLTNNFFFSMFCAFVVEGDRKKWGERTRSLLIQFLVFLRFLKVSISCFAINRNLLKALSFRKCFNSVLDFGEELYRFRNLSRIRNFNCCVKFIRDKKKLFE